MFYSLLLGVSAAGETTSPDRNGATNEQLQKESDQYLNQPGIDTITLKEDVYRACNTGDKRHRLQCVMDALDLMAKDQGMPLPPWTKYNQ